MVRGNADVRGTRLHQLQHRAQHAHNRAVRRVAILPESAQSVEVTEQFVRPVNEVNDHAALYDAARRRTQAPQ
jgi:hypothetical protein